jgi:branched-chain amino acid transport system substrate-binding protein
VKKASLFSISAYYFLVAATVGFCAYAIIFLFYGYGARNANLSNALEFAQSTPEYPPVDNNNWYKPDYRTFFLKQLPSFAKRLLYTLGVQKPYWSTYSFVSLLQQVTQLRNDKGYKGDFVQKIIPSDDTKYVLWGNLQGAFHSFVRDLEYLKEQSIINDELSIVDPTYYFIFTGNAISRSAYSLETLILILRLMKMNPDHVIYIKGTHEDHQYWQDFDMRTALRTRLWQQSGTKIPLSEEIDAFFDTLPYALFIVGNETNESLETLVISNELSHSKVIMEQLEDFLRTDSHAFIKYLGEVSQKKETIVSKRVRNRIHIVSNHYKPNAYLTEGLRVILPRTQAAIWTVLSSPTSSYKQRFNFNNDAFTIIQTKGDLPEWTITLCKQDSSGQEGFDCSQRYNLLSGFPFDFSHSFTDELVIGSSLDLSMVVQRFGEYLEEGMQARIRDENEQGGVNGKFIRLVVKDDGYHVRRARKNIEEFLQEGIDILLCPLGTATLESYLDLVKEKKVLVLFPAAGGHDNTIPYLIYYRPSSFDEGKVITNYALDKLNANKFGFFFPNDNFGILAMEGAKSVINTSDRASYKEFPYKRGSLSFTQQVKEMQEYNPGTIGFFSITPSAQEFIRQMGVHRLSEDQLIGLSDLTPDRFRRFLNDNGLSVTVTSVVPNPRVASNEFLLQYQSSMKKNKVDLNTNSLEGYIAASVFIEALKHVEGEVTKEKLVLGLESIQNFDLEGLSLNFNPETRSLADSLWIAHLPEGTLAEWERVGLN